MKKLLLYLMTLVAFGSVSVDAFSTEYLRILTSKDGYAGATSTEGDVEINTVMGASKNDVVIGDGLLAIGVFNDQTNKVTWYRPQSGSGVVALEPNVTMKMKAISPITNANGFDASKHAVMKIADGKADADDAFLVSWDARTTSLTVYADYSQNQVKYSSARDTNKSYYLSQGGDATFDVSTGDGDYVDVWFETKDGKELAYNIGAITNWESDPTYYYVNNVTLVNADNGTKRISGLKKFKTYRVTVGYTDRSFYIEELPTSIYVAGVGVVNNGWDYPNWAQDNLRFVEDSGLYTITVKVDGDTGNNMGYIALKVGDTADAAQYSIANNGADYQYYGGPATGKLTKVGKAIHNNGPERYLHLIVTLNEQGDPDEITIEEVPAPADTDYSGYLLTTKYLNGAQHTADRAEKIMNGDEWTGQWQTIDNGNGDFSNPANVLYDGLRLGYDPFYLVAMKRTDHSTHIWAYPGDEDIIPGKTYTLKEYNTEAEALAAGMKMADTGDNKVNTRYNIIWNWTTKELTVEPNEVWTSYPNQMYLYKLDQDEDYRTVDINTVQDALADEGQNKVYVFPLLGASDGVYQYTFSKDDLEDLPKDTRFCIVGRTGQVYNIATADGSAYQIGSDWADADKNYRVEMTRSESQLPAIVATSRLANNNCVVTIRANFTSEADGLQNAYVISFMEAEAAPTKFVLKKVGDSVEHDILPDANGNFSYSLLGLGLEKNEKYSVTAVFGEGDAERRVDYEPVGGNIVNDEIDRQLKAIDGEGGGETQVEPKLYVKVPANFGDAYLYAWDHNNSDQKLLGNWPGIKIETTEEIDGQKYYVYSGEGLENGLPTLANKSFIINNNSGTQTGNLLTADYGINGTNVVAIEVYEDSGYKAKKIDAPVAGGSPVGNVFNIATDMFSTNSRIYVQWNNGNPMMQIRKFGSDTKVRVYFVDRQKWNEKSYGNIYCYNWSDQGLSPRDPGNINTDWNETSDSNHEYPGAPMTLLSKESTPLYRLLGLENAGINIYSIELDVMENDGLYSRPKVQFNGWTLGDYTRQTYNLYLVDGGVYTNDSEKDNDGNIVFPQTTYLPRSQFTYMHGEDADLLSYPNEFYEADYNYIYLWDDTMVKWVEEGHKVAVNVVYDKDGDGVKEFVASGIPGQHVMQIREIAGIKFLRVAFADDVIPNDIKVDLSFWCVDYAGQASHIQWYSDQDGLHVDGTECDYDGHHYTGDHFFCKNSHCSLNFTDVEYKDGNIYRRYYSKDGEEQDPIVHILNVVKPEAFYIVPSQINAFKGAMDKNCLGQVEQLSVNGKTVNAYPMTYTDPENEEKLIYILPDVLASAQFRFIAKLGEGNYINYSCSTPTAMLPGQPYTYFSNYENLFSINNSTTSFAKNYEVRVSWTDSDVTITANKVDADFEFVAKNDNGDYVPLFGAGYLLPAHTDNCLKVETGTHLTPIYFTYAPGYDMENALDGYTTHDYTRLENLVVERVREPEYDRYFRGETANKEARIVEHWEMNEYKANPTNPYFVGGEHGKITIIQPSVYKGKDHPDNRKGLAEINLIGYTAVLTNVRIAQVVPSENFENSAANVPVRIYPTFESVGMTINNFAINEEYNMAQEGEAENKMVLFKQNEANIYTINLSHEHHTSTGANGDVEFRDRLHFQTPLADSRWMSFTWCENPDELNLDEITPRQYRAGASTSEIKNVMSSAPEYGQSVLVSNTKVDPFAGDHTTESGSTLDLGNYSIYNAPTVPVDSETQAPTSKSFYVKLNQNGISSPAYLLAVNRSADIPTEVEEILGADNDAEVEYYNLNGVKVGADRLEPGIYIKVQGTKSEKVYIR